MSERCSILQRESLARQRRRGALQLASTRVLFGLLSLVLLSGCGSTPAKLRHVGGAVAHHQWEESDLAAELDRIAAAGAESSAGKKAAREFFADWRGSDAGPSRKVGGWKVTFTSEWPAGYFDALLPAADYDVPGLNQRYTRDGRGIALVGCRQNRHQDAVETLYPPEMITRPVTAVFTQGPGRTMTVALRNSLRHDELAADFSAPLAELVGHAAPLAKMGFGGLLGSREARRRGHGLYLLEPYDPRKTPVIFVHGLLSTPLAWANVTNELWGDAEFRRRYQIWHYHYPTSAPFLYSAKLFREQIAKVRAQLDPRGTDPASARLDIVAHSMGGLLTRTLITDSDEAAWNGVFQVRPETLKGAPEDRATVDDILHWKARRDVRQVIFIAVPHRGSDMSGGIIGRIGDTLAGLPPEFTALYARLNRDNPEALQPAFREALSRGKLTSIDTLSPRHPLLQTMNTLTIKPWVTLHSIIGNRGSKKPLEQTSDGVVPYTSSHLDAAVSEVVVPTDHGAYKDPAAVAEILRILKADR